MDNNFKDLWRIIYEIEGLVLLAEKKSENIPQGLVSLLKEKTALFQFLINNVDSHSDYNQIEQESSEPILEDNIESPYIEEEEDSTKYFAIEPSAPTEAEIEVPSEIAEIEDTIEDVASDVIEEELDDTEIIEEDNPIEVIDDNLEIIEVENEIELEPEVEPHEIITVEEKLARQNSRDLKQAFTLNDRYRFRRELFGNSDTEFIDMINLVSAMASLSEAEDYFYGDLEWDLENEEVKDFMNIIAHYFADK